MANYITNSSGVRLSIRAITARPFANTKKIVSRLLDGSYAVQQIGTAAVRVDITVVVADKTALDAICANCEPITLNHYGTIYTGVIQSEEIAWEPAMIANRWYRGAFSLVVTE